MSKYYLRVEGVNMGNYISDTEDLSTIRGGSLALLNVVHHIDEMIKPVELTNISLGASAGLFSFEVDGTTEKEQSTEAEAVRGQLEAALKQSHSLNSEQPNQSAIDLKPATFVVDVIRDTSEYVRNREVVLAENRWRQMRQPRLAIPQWNETSKVLPCTLNQLKPGVDKVIISKSEDETKEVPASKSVKSRRDYGRSQKQRFYREHSDINPTQEFVHDLDHLTSNKSYGNLHHKMAIIYLDGNDFGNKQKACGSIDAQINFDTKLRIYQKEVLTALLGTIEAEPAKGWLSPKGDYQLETLLWGGDELIWVVPAWQGWATLSRFYDVSKDWNIDGRLTHAGGLVFCHHKAPIHRIVNLAKKLADEVKEDKERKKGNFFAYEILESFDHTGSELQNIRAKRTMPCESPDTLILKGEGMSDITKHFKIIKDSAPRRQLFRLLDQMRNGENPGAIEDTIKRLSEGKEVESALQSLSEYFGNNDTRWVHLAELWDYVGLDSEPEVKL